MAASVIRSLLLSAFLSANCACVCVIIDLHEQRHNGALNSFQSSIPLYSVNYSIASFVIIAIFRKKLNYKC